MSNYRAVPSETPLAPLSASRSDFSSQVTAEDPQPFVEDRHFAHFGHAKKTKWSRYYGRNTWALEIFSCTLSISMIIATFAILNHYEGHAAPVALPHNIKLGSILSIFSTIIKAAISIPLSAGLGQIVWSKLLQSHRPLMDIAIFDSASRGVLGGVYLLWKRPTSIVSVLGVCCCVLAFAIGPFIQATLGTTFVLGTSTLPRCETVMGDGLGTLFDQYQASVFLSAFKPSGQSDESLQGLNTNCLTGNCTWPTFSSLAICSNTTDLYNEVQQTFNPDGSWASLTLPNGLSLPHIENHAIFWNGSVTLPTINYNDWNYDPIARFSIIYYHGNFNNSDNGNFRAAEGVFYWCVQAYQAEVKKSILNSMVTSIWYPSELNTSASIQVLSPPPEEFPALGLTQATNFTIIDQGNEISFVNLSLDANNSGPDPPNLLEEIAGISPISFPDFFTYLASAMSNRMRSVMCDLTALGEMEQEQVLKVEWLWLVLPTVTVLLVCGFLAAVMLESRVHGSKTWKNSVLAVLFHGLSQSVREECEAGNVMDVSAMEEKARMVMVRLGEGRRGDGTGWLLRPRRES